MFELEDNDFQNFEFSHKRSVEIDLSCTASQNLKLFEEAIEETIKKLEKKYNKMCQKASAVSDKISRVALKLSEFEDGDGKFSELRNTIYELNEKEHFYHIESYWVNQQLKAISEMQIINAFKNVEINIKAMINIAYPEMNLKDLYKWENLVQFFKSKNIQLSGITGYKEIVDLKNLNNSIKHNGELNENIKKIEEFKFDDELDFVNLINFYERIKKIIETFLSLLVDEIKKELFQFDENRIVEIAQDFKNRMGTIEIESFIEKLKNS